MSTGDAARTVLDLVNAALEKAEHGHEHELTWLGGEVQKLLPLNNYQFFRRIAERRDSVQFLKWVFCLGRNSQEFYWLVQEAKKVYGSGIPPFQPVLLALVKQFEPKQES